MEDHTVKSRYGNTLVSVMELDWTGVDSGSNPLHLASKLFDSKSSLELQYIYILKIERLGIGMVL